MKDKDSAEEKREYHMHVKEIGETQISRSSPLQLCLTFQKSFWYPFVHSLLSFNQYFCTFSKSLLIKTNGVGPQEVVRDSVANN